MQELSKKEIRRAELKGAFNRWLLTLPFDYILFDLGALPVEIFTDILVPFIPKSIRNLFSGLSKKFNFTVNEDQRVYYEKGKDIHFKHYFLAGFIGIFLEFDPTGLINVIIGGIFNASLINLVEKAIKYLIRL